MTTAYDILFRLTFRHSYYADGLCRDLALRPTPSTLKRLQRYGLQFRATETGGMVIAEVQRGSDPPALVRSLPPEEARFSFLLLLNNPHFFTFTQFQNPPSNLPPRMGQEVLYLSNLYLPAPSGDERPLSDQVPSTALPYPGLLGRSILNLAYPSPTTQSAPTLQDVLGNAYHDMPRIASPEAVDQLQVDLRQIPRMQAGRYQVTASGPNLDVPFYYEPELEGQAVMGIVDLFNDTTSLTEGGTDEVDSTYKFLDGDQLRRDAGRLIADYTVDFDAAAVQLAYIIHAEAVLSPSASTPDVLTGLDLNDLRVDYATGESGPVTFGVPQVDGSTARITSDLANLSLHQQGPAFVLNRSDGGPTFITRLPGPSPRTPIKPSTMPNQRLMEVHVYL